MGSPQKWIGAPLEETRATFAPWPSRIALVATVVHHARAAGRRVGNSTR
jgi:hypothetical protein